MSRTLSVPRIVAACRQVIDLRHVAATALLVAATLPCAAQQSGFGNVSALDERPFSEQVTEATTRANDELRKRAAAPEPAPWDQDQNSELKQLPRVDAAPALRRYPAVNLELEAPGPPWTEMVAREQARQVRLVYTVPVLNRTVLLIAERIGVEFGCDNKQALDLSQGQLKARAPDAKFFNERKEAAGDFQGLRCEGLATLDGRMTYLVVWLAIRNGYVYQLISSGNPEDAESVDRDNQDFRKRLRMITSRDIAHVDQGTVVSKFTSSRFGYELDLDGLGWLQTGDETSKLPEADFAAVHGGPSGTFVVGVPLPKRKPPVDALTNAMIDQLGFVGEGDEILRTGDCRIGRMSGQEVEARRTRGEHRIRYQVRIVADDRYAYMVGGWTNEESDRLPLVKRSLDRFALSKQAPENVELTPAQQACCGKVLNNLGLITYAGGDHLAALDYFRSALTFTPSESAVVINCATVLSELNRAGEGLAVVNEFTKKHDGDFRVLALCARLAAENGDAEGARKMYQALFAKGCTDEAALIQYIGLAAAANEFNGAIAAVEAVLQRKPTLQVQRFHAELYGMQGDVKKSVEMFESLRKRYPAEPGVLIDLATAYERAGEYSAAIEITQQLVDSGRNDEETLLLHGRMQLHLEQFAPAKQTFEQAAQLYPRSEAAGAMLKYASSQLGQGDNSSIKSPIERVETPAIVRHALEKDSSVSAELAEKYGAIELSRVAGIQFEIDEPFRITTTRKVKVLTPNGVARFNKLTFKFDPTCERIYVNRLAVFDGSGTQVAEGSVENYYVVDDSDSGMASHSKILNIPVPGLKPGYTMEWTVTRQELAAAKEFPFQEVPLSSTTPVEVSAFFVRGDVGRLQWKSSGGVQVRAKGDVLYCVAYSPAVFRYEVSQPSIETFLPMVQVGEAGATWAKEAATYLSSIEDKLQLDDKTRAAGTELTRHCGDHREKLAVIAAHVQEGCRYQAIEFGRRARIPNAASRSLDLKYGDCKDHAVLLKQLLAGAGIESHLVLVKAQGTLVEELPSLDQFDHMVVYVPASSIGEVDDGLGGVIVDATQKDADILLTPPYGMGGKSVLVLDRHRPRMVRIPDYPEDAGRITCRRQITVGESESNGDELDAEVDEQVTFNDYVAPAMRAYLTQFEPDSRRQAVQELLSQNGPIRIRSLEVTNLDQPSKPLQFHLRYVAPGQFHAVASADGKSVVGKLPCPWEREYMEADYVESRETPFEVRMPMRVQSSVHVNVPPGYQLAAVDESTGKMKTRFASWSCNTSHDQVTVHVDYELHLTAGRHPAKTYEEFYSTMKESLSALQTRLMLSERATANARHPDRARSTK